MGRKGRLIGMHGRLVNQNQSPCYCHLERKRWIRWREKERHSRIQYAIVKMDFARWNSRVIDINENGVEYIWCETPCRSCNTKRSHFYTTTTVPPPSLALYVRGKFRTIDSTIQMHIPQNRQLQIIITFPKFRTLKMDSWIYVSLLSVFSFTFKPPLPYFR